MAEISNLNSFLVTDLGSVNYWNLADLVVRLDNNVVSDNISVSSDADSNNSAGLGKDLDSVMDLVKDSDSDSGSNYIFGRILLFLKFSEPNESLLLTGFKFLFSLNLFLRNFYLRPLFLLNLFLRIFCVPHSSSLNCCLRLGLLFVSFFGFTDDVPLADGFAADYDGFFVR